MYLVDTHLVLWCAFEPSLPWIHRDPFDGLLVAQAMEERLTLLTADAALKGYGRFVRVV